MSFDPFGDFESTGYLRNVQGLKDPVEVKKSEHFTFELGMEDALEYLARQRSLDYQTVLTVHELLFSGFYPWAGKDRHELVPHLAVFKGVLDDPHRTVFERPDMIRRSVEYAFQLAANQKRFKTRPGEVMGQLAFAHPFLDGNGQDLPSTGPAPPRMNTCMHSEPKSVSQQKDIWTNTWAL